MGSKEGNISEQKEGEKTPLELNGAKAKPDAIISAKPSEAISQNSDKIPNSSPKKEDKRIVDELLDDNISEVVKKLDKKKSVMQTKATYQQMKKWISGAEYNFSFVGT